MMTSNDRFCVEDLKKERAKCDFDQEELTNLIDGGKKYTDFRRKIAAPYLKDPVYDDEIPPDYMSHEDRYSNELRKACHSFKKFTETNISIIHFNAHGPGNLNKDGNPLSLHMSMFCNALLGQANEQQQQKWLPRATKGEIIGTYAQTELGHGTFLRGLETTATYDERTQEFVIHSPTITATKWWPGGLGKTSNYALVMAQLYSKGKRLGPHPFLVQIRDEDTHQSMPGVTVGEIGPRIGLNTNDNGFLAFNNYRIPRTNMLMKHSQVLEDGTYVKPPHRKLAYGTMVITRVGLVFHGCRNLQRAVTIAVRYSAVRRQSELVPGEPEPQILDYQTQQYKLIPHISSVFALLFAARNCRETYLSAMTKIKEGAMDLLPELHALSSGLKAIAGSDASIGVETCRLACGGHGYLSSSSLPRLYGGTTCMITYEGENTVLWLQVARYLIKSYRAASQGVPLRNSVAYLSAQPVNASTGDLSNEAGRVITAYEKMAECVKKSGLVGAFKRTVSRMVAEVDAKLQRLVSSGMNYHHAWNNCTVLLVKCAEAHIRYFVCEEFVRKVETANVSDGVRKLLKNLCRLYLVYHITCNEGAFLKAGVLSASDLSSLDEEMTNLLSILRHQAVSIVDSFDIDDKYLDSTLGSWDGNVYQRLYDEAMKSPLNKSDVPKAYYKYLRPLMKSSL